MKPTSLSRSIHRTETTITTIKVVNFRYYASDRKSCLVELQRGGIPQWAAEVEGRHMTEPEALLYVATRLQMEKADGNHG